MIEWQQRISQRYGSRMFLFCISWFAFFGDLLDLFTNIPISYWKIRQYFDGLSVSEVIPNALKSDDSKPQYTKQRANGVISCGGYASIMIWKFHYVSKKGGFRLIK